MANQTKKEITKELDKTKKQLKKLQKEETSSETEVKEKGGVRKAVDSTVDMLKTAGIFVADGSADVLFYASKSLIMVLTAIVAIQLLAMIGVVTFWSVALVAAVALGITALYVNFRSEGEDSHVTRNYRAVKDAVATSSNSFKEMTGLGNAA